MQQHAETSYLGLGAEAALPCINGLQGVMLRAVLCRVTARSST